MRSLSRFLTPALMLVAIGAAQAQDTVAPKLGPDAMSIMAQTEFLRMAPAPDYWAFASFVKPQFTNSACSIAAVTAAVNGLAGLPEAAEDTVLTQANMLELVGDEEWTALSAEGGDGVTFAQLEAFTAATIAAREMADFAVDSFKPQSNDTATLERLRQMLIQNEASADDALLIYFTQGVLTGDWDGPHVALIGAYDQARDAVLILEVDQEWYVPYWSPASKVLDAMLKPTSAEHGILEGETGGFVRIYRAG